MNMSGILLEPFLESETERLKQSYPNTVANFGQRFVRTKPGNCVLPAAYENFKDRFKNWQVRTDDVHVLTFPKNGTTWTQELVWCVQNDCNTEKAKFVPLVERFPFMEFSVLSDFMKSHNLVMPGVPVALIESMPSPRMLKSHLPFCLLPDDLFEKGKCVMCLRNPKDTVVSFYHHEKLIALHGYEGDFPTYFDLFMDNMVIYSSYFDHVVEAWKRRNHPNVCLLFFEEMKADLASSIRKVAKFLGKEITEAQVESLVDYLSFKKMKENRSRFKEKLRKEKIMSPEGDFMRKGEVGDWKNYFTDEMNKRMDEAIEKYFKPIGLEFRYE